MSWFKSLLHKVMGRGDRYHKQAQTVTAGRLRSDLRERRVKRLTAELELIQRGRNQ